MCRRSMSLDVLVVVWQIRILCILHLLLVLLDHGWVHLNFRWSQCRHSNEFQVGVSEQLASQIQERLLKVVVTLGLKQWNK
jgi:hypothetical protein